MIENTKFLKKVLGANALSCLVFGVIFTIWSTSSIAFISGQTSLGILIRVVGILLILNGLHLISALVRKRLHKYEVLYFSAGDGLWVLGTVILVSMGWLITTPHGIVSAILVAIMVGIFGLLQFKAVRS